MYHRPVSCIQSCQREWWCRVRIPYHYRFSMGTFKERPIHLHRKWRKWWGILIKLSWWCLFVEIINPFHPVHDLWGQARCIIISIIYELFLRHSHSNYLVFVWTKAVTTIPKRSNWRITLIFIAVCLFSFWSLKCAYKKCWHCHSGR